MIISKRISSVLMLVLSVSLAFPFEGFALSEPAQIEMKVKKPELSLQKKFYRFVHKHQRALSVLGMLGVLALMLYVVPQGRIEPPQLPRFRPLNLNPAHVNEAGIAVGASQCVAHQIMLQPGIHHGNWTPHLVDGNDGRYAWRDLANGHRQFVVRTNLDTGEYEHNHINIHFQLQDPIRISQLRVLPQRGDSCAYHALKNCQLILDEFHHQRGNLMQRLQDPALAQERLARWQAHILRNHRNRCSVQEGARAGDWLHPEGLRELVNLEGEEQRITVVDAGRFQERLAQNPFDVPRAFNLHAIPAHGDWAHGFLVQDRAHWLTAVVRREQGQFEWLIVDSNNRAAFNLAGLMHLLASLHGRPV